MISSDVISSETLYGMAWELELLDVREGDGENNLVELPILMVKTALVKIPNNVGCWANG